MVSIAGALDFQMFAFVPDAYCILGMVMLRKSSHHPRRVQRLFWCDAAQSVCQRGCSQVCRVRGSGTLRTAACLLGTPDGRSFVSVSDWTCVRLSVLVLLHCHVRSRILWWKRWMKPCCLNNAYRYEWELLSKASFTFWRRNYFFNFSTPCI